MELKTMNPKLVEVGARIREMREISGYSVSDMARLTEVSVKEYQAYENGQVDFPFTFIQVQQQIITHLSSLKEHGVYFSQRLLTEHS